MERRLQGQDRTGTAELFEVRGRTVQHSTALNKFGHKIKYSMGGTSELLSQYTRRKEEIICENYRIITLLTNSLQNLHQLNKYKIKEFC